MSSETLTPRQYFGIFWKLMALLVLTIGAAYLNLGPFNTPVAVGIALLKAALIILFFMHVKFGSRLTWLMAGAGFFWLAILLTLAMMDYLTRGW